MAAPAVRFRNLLFRDGEAVGAADIVAAAAAAKPMYAVRSGGSCAGPIERPGSFGRNEEPRPAVGGLGRRRIPGPPYCHRCVPAGCSLQIDGDGGREFAPGSVTAGGQPLYSRTIVIGVVSTRSQRLN